MDDKLGRRMQKSSELKKVKMGVLAGFLERRGVFEIRCDTAESLLAMLSILCKTDG